MRKPIRSNVYQTSEQRSFAVGMDVEIMAPDHLYDGRIGTVSEFNGEWIEVIHSGGFHTLFLPSELKELK